MNRRAAIGMVNQRVSSLAHSRVDCTRSHSPTFAYPRLHSSVGSLSSVTLQLSSCILHPFHPMSTPSTHHISRMLVQPAEVPALAHGCVKFEIHPEPPSRRSSARDADNVEVFDTHPSLVD